MLLAFTTYNIHGMCDDGENMFRVKIGQKNFKAEIKKALQKTIP